MRARNIEGGKDNDCLPLGKYGITCISLRFFLLFQRAFACHLRTLTPHVESPNNKKLFKNLVRRWSGVFLTEVEVFCSLGGKGGGSGEFRFSLLRLRPRSNGIARISRETVQYFCSVQTEL